MDKQEFIADFISKNSYRPGTRRRASQLSDEQLREKAEKAWEAHNTPMARASRELQAIGGNYWSSDDSSKRRIYFNEVQVIDEPQHKAGYDDRCDVYFDLISGQWMARGKELNAQQLDRVKQQIGL